MILSSIALYAVTVPHVNLGGPALQRFLMVDQLLQIYRDALAHPSRGPFFENLLALLNVNPIITRTDLARIPASGAVVAVANHPFGMIESSILGALLPTVRADVKFMANSLLCQLFPAIADRIIAVDPFGGEAATKANRKGMREALLHLKAGGMLVVFPAGEVAHVNLQKRQITDPEWSTTIARLVRMTKSPVLPIYFAGANSAWFQVLGLLHARVRTMMLVHEFFNKRNRNLEMRVGSLIPAKRLQAMDDDVRMMAHLRERTYFLQHRGAQSKHVKASTEPIAAAVDSELLQSEIEALPPDRKLADAGEFSVYYAKCHEAPNVLFEIGRLREIAFRDAGEGTGKAIDLDSCDAYYLQLFLWNNQTREIAGAYRIGPTDTILERYGKNGLYTSTLFAFADRFLHDLGDALELGRSFVRVEYQKSYTPLLLLWKGIGAYVARNPRYKILFGPVSISNDYQPVSRQLMVNFFRRDDRAPLVKARSPFRAPATSRGNWDVEDLSAMVADIESDQKGIPVLLRHYLKMGGELLGFNVDRNFSDSLDGLIVVDLTRTDKKMLNRYLGVESSTRFLEYHRMV